MRLPITKAKSSTAGRNSVGKAYKQNFGASCCACQVSQLLPHLRTVDIERANKTHCFIDAQCCRFGQRGVPITVFNQAMTLANRPFTKPCTRHALQPRRHISAVVVFCETAKKRAFREVFPISPWASRPRVEIGLCANFQRRSKTARSIPDDATSARRLA